MKDFHGQTTGSTELVHDVFDPVAFSLTVAPISVSVVIKAHSEVKCYTRASPGEPPTYGIGQRQVSSTVTRPAGILWCSGTKGKGEYGKWH